MEIHASVLQGDLYVRICGEMDEHSAALARKEADKLAENNFWDFNKNHLTFP